MEDLAQLQYAGSLLKAQGLVIYFVPPLTKLLIIPILKHLFNRVTSAQAQIVSKMRRVKSSEYEITYLFHSLNRNSRHLQLVAHSCSKTSLSKSFECFKMAESKDQLLIENRPSPPTPSTGAYFFLP